MCVDCGTDLRNKQSSTDSAKHDLGSHLKAEYSDPSVDSAPFREVEFAHGRPVLVSHGTSRILRNSIPLGIHAKTTFDYISTGSAAYPDRICIAERAGSGWRSLTYAAMESEVDQLAQALIDNGITRGCVVATLSPNSIAQAVLQLAVSSIGAIFAPISPGYGRERKSYDLLREVLGLLKPALLYVSDDTFGEGLKKAGFPPQSTVIGEDGLRGLRRPVAQADLRAARALVVSDDTAKIMLTSGSTGLPKGVRNTHRMIASNQAGIAAMWPFLQKRPPVTCCWLPWNHTMGGNFSFYMMLANGGSFFIDDGRPTPDGIQRTVDNLTSVRPTMHFNVPRGIDTLLPYLECGHAGKAFFDRLDVICFSGAAMPASMWERIKSSAVRATGSRVHVVTSWGTTETAPAITLTCGDAPDSSFVGLPLPGVAVKLAVVGDLLEGRVQGPNVMPGYVDNEIATAGAFDEDGFYATGDAIRMVNRGDQLLGVAYGGRVAENFKLSTGSWVHVGSLRVKVLTATSPLLQDCVLAGEGQDELGVLAFLNFAAVRDVLPDLPDDPGEVARDPRLHQLIIDRLSAFNSDNRAATHAIRRVCLEVSPLNLEAGETTDKGYVNQKGVLRRRKASVDALFAAKHESIVILVN
jgi:feruloyl-CoA synthase